MGYTRRNHRGMPKAHTVFGVDKLLVNPLTGKTRLYNKGQVEDLPVDCSTNKFQESILTTVLADAAAQCDIPIELPGERWPTTLHEPLDENDPDRRLGAFSDLVSMHARNQIALINATMLPRGERVVKVPKVEIKGRKISNRMDEFIAVFMQDNNWREIEGLPVYPLPKTNPVGQNIHTAKQVAKITIEAKKEIEGIMQIAYRATGVNAMAETATALTDRVGRVAEQRAPSPAFNMPREEGNRPTAAKDTMNSFIVPTAMTNCQGCQENRHNSVLE